MCWRNFILTFIFKLEEAIPFHIGQNDIVCFPSHYTSFCERFNGNFERHFGSAVWKLNVVALTKCTILTKIMITESTAFQYYYHIQSMIVELLCLIPNLKQLSYSLTSRSQCLVKRAGSKNKPLLTGKMKQSTYFQPQPRQHKRSDGTYDERCQENGRWGLLL